LRREEVAGLAGVSMDYYTRLEQGRGPRPSRQTLGALARALRLTADARDHLFRLAGEEPPARRASGAGGHVPPGLLLVLDRLVDVAARVLDPLGEVLAQNALSAALFGDLSDRPPADRNLTRRWFTDPAARDRHPAGDHREHSRRHVAQLRAVLSARREDRAAAALVAELRAASAEFAELWDEHEVARRRSDRERVVHPLVGPLELDCQVLLTEEGADDGWGCRLVLLTARPGTPSHQALELLRVVGLQDMTPPRPA
jgi:transcriptional regulator with XRE-family HTH domain